ncbi:restriction endonuclease subunit S [Lactococcus lactis]|uniref:restriction endonuclease subunit S n=1 Tax=Lactococcus lactis TaxID=1358 RepID=UPI00207C9375|nr:restriction endonuclease subunit S [Lactococcus lactis]MCO0817498.1 restriction endonuclease subunit S [Lactococcus lactis]
MDAGFNQQINSLTPTSENDSYFLLTQSEKWSEKMKQTAASATMQIVNKTDFSNISTYVPVHKEEQEKIGSFFKQLDDTIDLHQRKLDLLKEQKKGYLQKMFPKNGAKVPELRFAGFADDWEQRKLGEVGYFYYGKSAPKWSVTEDAEIPCVRYGELYTRYGAKISNIYSHTNINPKNLKFSTGNEVLVPRVGENPLDFSLCSWLSIPNVAIGEMISVYNTNENPLFISYYFRGQMKYEFAKRVEGGNVSNLYYSYLEDIDLYIPKLEEQIAISKFFENLDDTIALHQCKLDLLKEQKKGFLQKMFV